MQNDKIIIAHIDLQIVDITHRNGVVFVQNNAFFDSRKVRMWRIGENQNLCPSIQNFHKNLFRIIRRRHFAINR